MCDSWRVVYASGRTGKTVRADGEGGFLARGWYVLSPAGSHAVRFGPFKTKTEANLTAGVLSR